MAEYHRYFGERLGDINYQLKKKTKQNKTHAHKKRKKAEVFLVSSKETLICVWRAGHSEDQDQDLLLRVAVFQKSKSLTPNSEP